MEESIECVMSNMLNIVEDDNFNICKAFCGDRFIKAWVWGLKPRESDVTWKWHQHMHSVGVEKHMFHKIHCIFPF